MKEIPSDRATPSAILGGQRRFTRAEYDRLAPFQQGLITYMQGAWNKDVQNSNIYRRGTKQYDEFTKGEQRGVQIAQDGDDE